MQAAHGELLLDIVAGHGEDPLCLGGFAQIPVGLFRLLEPDARLFGIPFAAPLAILHHPFAGLHVVEPGVVPADAEQVDVIEGGALEVGITEIGLHQATALHAQAVEVTTAQVGAIEVALLQQKSLIGLLVDQIEASQIGP